METLILSQERQAVLDQLISYCVNSIKQNNLLRLNFVCTHNSRRSQFSQFWAQIAAEKYDIPFEGYSSGVEVTACNDRTIAAIKRAGFKVDSPEGENPKHEVQTPKGNKVVLFSKTFEDASCPKAHFAAVMTCSHAEENCPFIPGAEARIPLRYDDPKAFDDTNLEESKYGERSKQIAQELDYVFKAIKGRI